MKNGIVIFLLLCLASSCQFFETEKISTETFYEEELKSIDWKDVDQYPAFAQCEAYSEKLAQKSCFENTLSSRIHEFINTKKVSAARPLNDTVKLKFSVTKEADLSVLKIQMDSLLRTEFPLLEEWISESIDSIEVVAPAYKRGIPIKTQFTLPIVIKTGDL